MLKHFLLTLSFCWTINPLFADGLDTIRRLDEQNREFFQVKFDHIVVSEGYYMDGEKEGTWITYWNNGFPREITSYRQDKKSGIHLQINVQGFTERIENYSNDLLNGPVRVYQPGNMQALEVTYYSDGKKHGFYEKRYPSGALQETGRYNMGKRDGKTTWYYDSGEKAAENMYRNGILQGDMATFFENGRTQSYGLAKNGEKSGLWKVYYENGNLKEKGHYENGEKEGIWHYYDENGQEKNSIQYVNGNPK